MSARRSLVRLSNELKDANASGDADIHLELYDASKHGNRVACASSPELFTWVATLTGPSDSPFEGGHYRVLLRIPNEYPMVPPAATFMTKVFHPNVEFSSGTICLDILKGGWSPAWTLNALCRAILNLLAEPEPNSPFNCDAGNLVRAGDMEGYRSMVRMYSIMEAGAPPYTDFEG